MKLYNLFLADPKLTRQRYQLDTVSWVLGHSSTNITRQIYQAFNMEKIKEIGE